MSDPKREYYPPDIFSFSGESIEIDLKKDKQKSFAVYRAKIQKTEELEEDAAANCFLTMMILTRTALTQWSISYIFRE